MFRKLVSNLPYSPALVGQLGFYARRLRQEEGVRRLGLIFTALALVVQSFAVFSPPDPANAANPSDFIYGGISTKTQLLSAYDASARGNGDLKNIFDYAGITRAELNGVRNGTINSREKGTGSGAWLSWGRQHRFSADQGEVKHDANGSTIYSRPLHKFDSKAYTIRHGSTYQVLIGQSAKMGTFAIIKDCANLVTTKLPIPPPPPPPPAPKPETRCSALTLKRIDRTTVSLTARAEALNGARITGYEFSVKNGASTVATDTKTTGATTAASDPIELPEPANYTGSVVVKTSIGDKTSANCAVAITVAPPDVCPLNPEFSIEDEECQPCPDNEELWYKDADCAPKVASSKEAKNLSQNNIDATTTTANASDRIQYTISVYNVGKVPATVEFKEELADTLEYATIQDNGAGTFDDEAKVLSWDDVVLQPGEKESRSFVVSLVDTIPSTPQGTSDRTSYDCIMTNAFGTTVNVDVNCTTPKLVEGTIAELPKTGPGENILFAGILATTATFFYARSRTMSKEVRLIRKEFNMGTI